MTGNRGVSVVIPAYRSEGTIAGCLEALGRQTRPAAEIVVVDSSPDAATATAVGGRYPGVRLHRSPQRLLPHAARNSGVAASSGGALLFLDPDIYLHEDAVERLLAAHASHGGLIAAALSCHGRRWLDRGVHLTKFSKWLPAGPARRVDVAPTAAMMCAREVFDELGGFAGGEIHGDALFSWEAVRHGQGVWLEPGAVGVHHHLHGPGSFVRERFTRGTQFARLRSAYERWGRPRALLYLAASLLPVRLGRSLALVARQAAAAGIPGEFLVTCPVIVAGFAASLAGEAWGLAGALAARRSRAGRGAAGG